MSLRTGVFASLLLGAAALPAWAADYYVAPQGAAPVSSPDGSKARPFASISAALGSGKIAGGDTILLMDGSHGPLVVKSFGFDQPVTIRSETPKGAHLDYVQFHDMVRNVTLKDLRIWRPEGSSSSFIVQSYSGSKGIGLEGLDVRSRENAIDYVNWDVSRWTAVAGEGGNGIDLQGSGNFVRESTVTGVRYGIMVGSNSVVEGNVINGYTADGLRACQDVKIIGNKVMNSIELGDGVHRDMLQCYSPRTTSGLIIEGNYFLDWTLSANHPLRARPQGIGMYDGYYDNLRIANNVVLTPHAHGISVYGARGAVIVNNTVVNSLGAVDSYPWVMVTNRKDGSPSSNVVVANNMAMKFNGKTDTANNIVFSGNGVILDPDAVFVDFARRNFYPVAASGFLDVANPTYAPATDILGNARPSGAGPDLGAYEVGATGGAAPADSPTVTEPAPAPAPAPEDTTSGSTLGTDSSTGTGGTTTTESSGSTSSGTDTSGSTSGSTTTTTGTSGSTSTSGTTTTTTTTTTTDGRTAGKWSKPPSSLKLLRRR